MKILLISLSFISPVFAGTFSSNTGAFFEADTVHVRVASNTDCSKAGTDVDELVSMINPAINDYWNTVSTSRLKLANGGRYETSDDNFNDGRLCNIDTDKNCEDNGDLIPKTPEIVITCNDNTAFNFKGDDATTTYAQALPNNISGNHINGSVIIINNTASTPFSSLSYQQKIWIIAHEIGHAIGIGHTPNSENLMFWTTTPDRFALGPDDAMALTYLYPKQIDGCGLIGSIKDHGEGSSLPGSFLAVMLGSFSLLLFLLISFKKIFFKRQKPVF